MTESPLDAAADRLARRLLAAHPPTHAYGRAAIAGLPPAVARVLSLGLDHTADALAHPRSPWLDTASPALAAAQGAFAEAVRGAVRYPPEAWTEAVETAAHVALRLLVHPADGLAAVAFDRDPAPRAAADVLARVRAATPYAYLPDVAARYAERKGLDVLDRDALARLLARIERRMSDTLSPADWLALAEPLLDTVGPDGQPPGTVDAALVRAFFEARGHGALVDGLPDGPVARAALLAGLGEAVRLQAQGLPSDGGEATPAEAPAADDASGDAVSPEILPADEPLALSPTDEPSATMEAEAVSLPVEREDDVERWVQTPDLAMSDPLTSEPTTSAREASSPERPATASLDDAPTPSTDESSADDEPLWRRLARQHAAAAPSPAEQAPSADGSPLWQRFAPADARPPTHAVVTPPAGRAPAVIVASPAGAALSGASPPGALDRRVLGAAADQRDTFVASLFGGDASAFEATLAALDAAPTWTAATQIIARDIFHRPGVDMYGDTALAFTDAVQAAKDRA